MMAQCSWTLFLNSLRVEKLDRIEFSLFVNFWRKISFIHVTSNTCHFDRCWVSMENSIKSIYGTWLMNSSLFIRFSSNGISYGFCYWWLFWYHQYTQETLFFYYSHCFVMKSVLIMNELSLYFFFVFFKIVFLKIILIPVICIVSKIFFQFFFCWTCSLRTCYWSFFWGRYRSFLVALGLIRPYWFFDWSSLVLSDWFFDYFSLISFLSSVSLVRIATYRFLYNLRWWNKAFLTCKFLR